MKYFWYTVSYNITYSAYVMVNIVNLFGLRQLREIKRGWLWVWLWGYFLARKSQPLLWPAGCGKLGFQLKKKKGGGWKGEQSNTGPSPHSLSQLSGYHRWGVVSDKHFWHNPPPRCTPETQSMLALGCHPPRKVKLSSQEIASRRYLLAMKSLLT